MTERRDTERRPSTSQGEMLGTNPSLTASGGASPADALMSVLASRTVTLYISVIWATRLSTLVWQCLQTHVLGKQPGQSYLKRPAGDVESSGNATLQYLKRAPYLCLHCPKTNKNGMPLMVTRSWTFVSKLRCLHELLPVYPLRIRKFGVRFSWPELGQVEVRSVVKWDRLEAP